jgi:Zn-dependent protease with chaperone function
MSAFPDHSLLAAATAVAAAKRIPLNAFTIVFLAIGLAFAVWLVVMAMFYGRKTERSADETAEPSVPAGARSGPDDR